MGLSEFSDRRVSQKFAGSYKISGFPDIPEVSIFWIRFSLCCLKYWSIVAIRKHQSLFKLCGRMLYLLAHFGYMKG